MLRKDDEQEEEGGDTDDRLHDTTVCSQQADNS
jgi:hypothetical protein